MLQEKKYIVTGDFSAQLDTVNI